MGSVKRALIGLCSVVVLVGGITMVTPFTSEAEAGWYKKAKGVTHKKLHRDHKKLRHLLEEVLANLPEGGGEGGEGNHTLRWDQSLDSTDGENDGCNSSRFKCIFGDLAVLDLETGLVWWRSPDTTTSNWTFGRENCVEKSLAGVNKKGWRLPSFSELASLVDESQGPPTFPANHPFKNVGSFTYWTATKSALNDSVWVVEFGNGDVFNESQGEQLRAWCVRGGHNDGSQY